MAASGSKCRILYLAKVLMERTDENHWLSRKEITDILKSDYGLSVDRGTFADDIRSLIEFGFKIDIEERNKKYYCIVKRDFDVPELKMIIDAINSARFISQETSEELSSRIASLAGKVCAEELKNNIAVEGRTKAENKEIFWIIDAINTGIIEKKKIRFQYFHYNVAKEKILDRNGEYLCVSPYNLVWNGEYYYMVGFCDNTDSVRTYRVDRVFNTPLLVDEDIVPAPADYDINEFLYTTFRMFNSPKEKVKLCCSNDVVNSIIDRFGVGVPIVPVGNEKFEATVNVAVSHIFYGWVFGFGGKVRIVEPAEAVRGYNELAKRAFE